MTDFSSLDFSSAARNKKRRALSVANFDYEIDITDVDAVSLGLIIPPILFTDRL